jgi:hypothetical protein
MPSCDAGEAAHLALGAGFAGARAAATLPGSDLPRALDALTTAAALETPLVAWVLGEPHPLVRLDGAEDSPLVLRPGSEAEALRAAAEAFALAERWRHPVVVLGNGARPQFPALRAVLSSRTLPGQEVRLTASGGPVDVERRRKKLHDALKALRAGEDGGGEPPQESALPRRSPVVSAKALPPEAYLDGKAVGAPRELAAALGRLGTAPKDVLLVTGPGCPEEFALLRVHRLHAHSGALAAAQGAKLANPGLTIAAALDASREPAHLVEALRRGLDMVCLSFGPPPPISGLDAPLEDERVFRALRHKGFSFLLFPSERA